MTVVGRFVPPYRPLTPAEDEVARIWEPGVHQIWVGLGMPKQELWMPQVRDRLPGTTLLGIRTMFDLMSSTVPQASGWLQDRGLKWAYRLCREPRRLWRPRLFNNPALAALATAEVVWLRARNQHHG